jgi:hypothetical protein
MDISGGTEERAARNIKRAVEMFLQQPFTSGEVRVMTSWINPKAMQTEWIVEQMRRADSLGKLIKHFNKTVDLFGPQQ